MGSSRGIVDEEATYDAIYRIAHDVLKEDIANVRTKETKLRHVDVPVEYAYMEQIHGGYHKSTLQHEVFDVTVDFLCEINVPHGNIAKGRKLSRELQSAFYLKAPTIGLVVRPALATDSVTTSGHKFVVSLELTYKIRMV